MVDDAKRYHRRQFLLGALALGLTAAYLVAVLVAGVGPAFDRWARGVSSVLAWRVAVVAAAIAVGHGLLTFPLAWIRGYRLPRRYGLLHQTLGGWLADRLKAAVVGGVFGLVAVEIVYALMATTPRWWLLASGVLIALEIAVAFVFPVWLLPLFYRLTPLADDAPLRQRVLALTAKAGIAVVGVWVADQSRKGRTANAALAGLGRTRRVILFDTLVARFTPEEVGAVLSHELGHHVHRDVWRMLGVQAALTLLALWLADAMLRIGAVRGGWQAPWDPAGLPWLVVVVATLGLATTPLVNAFSRHVERQADDFAIDLTGDSQGFVGAMERLADLNLAERRPHRLKELLLYSHPSIERRIIAAKARRPAAPNVVQRTSA
jgi:STE24 endopeptidase